MIDIPAEQSREFHNIRSQADAWKQQAWTRDEARGIYIPHDCGGDFPYSDGDDAESRLLRVIREANDLRVGSLELSRSISDFTSRYHLSSRRANLLRPLSDLLKGFVLVGGAGCGAGTRYIGELGAEVWALEGSRRRAEICAQRCRDLPNVSVFCTPIEEFQPPVRFDAMTLIGVLEYSPQLLGAPDGPLRLLNACRKFLRPDGVLILGIENLLGLKYFAGAPEDHTGVPFANMNAESGRNAPVTFGRTELIHLLREAGFDYCDFLYPFPDYKFPRVIANATAANALGESLGEIIQFASTDDGGLRYERLFAEEMCWPLIVRNGLLEEFANSFLVVGRQTPEEKIQNDRAVYLYADMRRREYAKESVIEKCDGALVVRPRKLYRADPPPTDAPFSQVLRDEPFLRGHLLLDGFLRIVNQPGWTTHDVVEWGLPWLHFLKSNAIAVNSENESQTFLPPDFVDCTPSNLMVLHDGRLAPFDQEWIASKLPSLAFVVFRGLFGMFVQIRSIAVPDPGVPRKIASLCRLVMSEWGLSATASALQELVLQECEFQALISGIPTEMQTYVDATLPPVRHDYRRLRALSPPIENGRSLPIESERHERPWADHFDSGAAIVPILVKCYWAADAHLRAVWSYGITSTGFGSFFAWLNAASDIPAEEEYQKLGITNLAAFLYQERPDVRAEFPNVSSQDRPRFISWFLTYGRAEYALDPAFFEGTAVEWQRWLDAQKKAGYAGAIEEVEAPRPRTEAEGRAFSHRIAALEDDCAKLSEKLLASQAEARELARSLDDAQRQQVQTSAALSRLQCAAGEMRHHLDAVYAAADRYSKRFQSILTLYRSQRAWQLMLTARRAYAMIVPHGLRGCLRFLFGPRPPIGAFDLEFPSLPGSLPPRPKFGGSYDAKPPESNNLARRSYDLVILAIIDFDFRYQRPQQIASEFARRGHRVFWVSPTRTLPPHSPEPYQLVPLRELIWEVHVRAPQSDPYHHPLTGIAVQNYQFGLDVLFEERAIAECAIVAQLPFWRRLALALRRDMSSIVVYDCMDDWDTFENLGDFNRTEETQLVAECDILAVTAEGLKRKFAGRGLKSLLVRNGADFDFFRSSEPLAELLTYPRPIVGYFGAIADWLDLELLFAVAQSRPQYSFVLAGEIFGRDTSVFESLSNVTFLGSRPYGQMPRLLAAFDVCIIPFLLNQVTHATDPVKLYEYLSQGKAVVATDMSELRAFEELIYLARGSEDFAEKLDAAIAEQDPAMRARRIDFARQNSWGARVSILDEAIRKRFPLVSILVVSHNSAEFLGACLRALITDTAYPSIEVIVVDNASVDRSAAIAQEFARQDERIRVISMSSNRGFAAGNNAAADLAKGEYLILLNADAMVAPGWLSALLRHVSEDPTIGVICPVTNFAGNEAKINVDYTSERTMREFAMRIGRENRGNVMDISVAPLYCGLMRRQLFIDVGGLDEGYAIGMFEDDDLAEAVRKRGLRVCVAEDSFVHHFGQGSFSQLPPDEYNRIFEANRKRFEEKWNTTWVCHRTRPDVRPPSEESPFIPEQFCSASSQSSETSAAPV